MADPLTALKEIARLRLATDEGSLRVRADRMWDLATKTLADAVRGAVSLPAEKVCPFCGDDGFDLIGLKIHINAGHCDAFNGTEVGNRVY